MKKFSKINESLDKEYFDWSVKDILDILNRIPKCKASFEETFFTFRDSDGDELCSMDEIKKGGMESYLYGKMKFEDELFHPHHTFMLNFDKPEESYFFYENGLELPSEESMPFFIVFDIFKSIEDCLFTSGIKNDFYIYLCVNNKGFFTIRLDILSKHGLEREHILSK